MLNHITLMGRLTKDPELRRAGTDVAVASFTVAVDRDIADKTTGQRETDFIDCVAWGKTAEAIGNYVHKGQRLLVEGTLNIRSYEGKDGAKHRSAEINVRNFHFIEKAEKKGFGEDMGNVMEADIDVSNVPF